MGLKSCRSLDGADGSDEWEGIAAMSFLDFNIGIVPDLPLGADCAAGRGSGHPRNCVGFGVRPARFRQAGIHLSIEGNHFVGWGPRRYRFLGCLCYDSDQ